MEKTIKNVQDLYDMLDAEFRSAKQFWEPFYEERNRPIPFFPNKPDENLVAHVNSGMNLHHKKNTISSMIRAVFTIFCHINEFPTYR
ncbi:hypothetical protein QP794_03255 [Paenibacillus sp. UMB7766-LJ446]|uniref:hypothetical protein n=1 Tax=Paenibacillus sp. UMB7766-LJ446 TaxID=3046313 RepID=UPI00254E83D2|nr:hypothetical protein [Paenibacillus sp. UMB7766-LJ446]MDK8189100.1 hypothetical protein [Paenibacillus sp. UMB7766-LJ446]